MSNIHNIPTLSYSYDALEPHIDAKTMEIHHTKHHQTYVTGLNTALEKLSSDLQQKDVEDLLSNLNDVPEAAKADIIFHGGGHYNHSIFWNTIGPNGGGEPGGDLADSINSSFGNYASFKEQFTTAATKLRGSGWTWLTYNPSGSLEIKSMTNQTSPIVDGAIPLLGIDVWEHAYYLKYQNRRPEYIAAWWNTINWNNVGLRFQKARA